MKKQLIAIIAALGISFAAVAPANAQFWGGYGPVGWGWGGGYGYGGFGGWGYGGYGYGAAALGAGLAAGVVAGAIASSAYGYGPAYGYAVPAYGSAPRVKKNIIIKNSPGATVIEEDDIFGGW
jgi:hypothetical protein